MLIHKLCKELLIFLLLLLPLLAEDQFSRLRFLYTAQVSFTLVCSFNDRLGGSGLSGRLCGRVGFLYFDSHLGPVWKKYYGLYPKWSGERLCIKRGKVMPTARDADIVK